MIILTTFVHIVIWVNIAFTNVTSKCTSVIAKAVHFKTGLHSSQPHYFSTQKNARETTGNASTSAKPEGVGVRLKGSEQTKTPAIPPTICFVLVSSSLAIRFMRSTTEEKYENIQDCDQYENRTKKTTNTDD